MSREQAMYVVPGDQLTPIPLWNDSSPRHHQISVPCTVIRIECVRNCQSGFMFTVHTVKGVEISLDAAWFRAKAAELPPITEEDLA